MKSILKDLRQTFGLSQRQLAAFIGGDRTQLVRAEKGERNLADNASLQLVLLVPAWSRAKEQTMVPPPPNEKTRLEWQQHAARCRHQVFDLEKRLTLMQEAYVSAARLLTFANELLERPVSAYTTRQTRWLEERKYEAEKRMAQSDGNCQKSLQLKMASLKAEAALFETAGV